MATNPPLPEPEPDDNQPAPDPGPDTVARPAGARPPHGRDAAPGGASNGGSRPDPAKGSRDGARTDEDTQRSYSGPANPNATRRR